MSTAPERPSGTTSGEPSVYQAPTGAQPTGGYAQYYPSGGPEDTATGQMLVAGALLVLGGLWEFLLGLAAVIRQSFFVVTPHYVYRWNITGWGWTHLSIGVLAVAAGACVFLGMGWARWAGIVVATGSAIASFMFLPYYPIWAIVVIAVDVFIIWALSARYVRSKA